MNQDLTTLICLFHHPDQAQAAFEDVLRANVPEENVSLTRSARVVEEVVVSRVSGEYVEHVHDTLRHTEVEVEQISPDGASRRAQH